MAFIKPKLPHFFDSHSKESEAEIEDGPERERKATHEQGEADVPEKESIPPEDEFPPKEPTYLKLDSTHPIRSLWSIREQASGSLPAPALHLDVPPGQPPLLTPEETKKELSRLLYTVSSTANKRLLVATLGKGKDAGPPTVSMHAEVVMFSTADNLAAWFLIYPPVGEGDEVNGDMLDTALRRNGIRHGVIQEIVDAIPSDSNRYFHMHLIARGDAPVHGEDGYIEDLFSRELKWAPKMSESGQIDYTELNLIQNVNKGETICKIIPPTQGVPGRSVLGQPIPNKPGKPATPPAGRNTELSKDGSCLNAALTGRVEFSGGKFSVNPMLEIKGNVDYSTGSITFLGDVLIMGDVCTGFNVKALGSVTINGVVEACKIEAGGDLTIQKGVKGDNQGIIQTRHSLYAKYLENCEICVRENLQSDCIINCTIYSDGSVYADSGRGVIIGSKIRAANSVYARTVGTKAGSHISIKLGGLPSAEFDHVALAQELTRLTTILEMLEQQPDSPAKLKGLPTVRANITATITKLRQQENILEELHIQEYVQKYNEQRLICDTVYPGTDLSIGYANMPIKTEVRYCKAALVSGEIRLI